jgi:hypothetical protein
MAQHEVNTLSPKSQFLKQAELAKEFGQVAHSDNFHRALTYAISEYAHTVQPPAERLQGVHQFVGILLNLADATQPQRNAPFKKLSVTNG